MIDTATLYGWEENTVLKSIVFVVGLTLIAIVPAKAEETLRIATEGAYPPFNQVDPDGSLSGFDIDIANALCDDIKAKCEIVKQDWDGMIPGLLARKYDLIVASMTITDERQKKVDFTHKYYQAPDVFSAKKGSGFTISPQGLKGKIIGVQRGTIHACYVQKKFSDSQIKFYPSQLESFSDLMAGRLDLVFADSIGTDQQLLKADGGDAYEIVGDTQKDHECLGEGIGIALRKGNDKLRDRLNTAIDDIRANGTYGKINAKYFSFDIYGN